MIIVRRWANEVNLSTNLQGSLTKEPPELTKLGDSLTNEVPKLTELPGALTIKVPGGT
ncbi:hypothetical protein [Aquimarina sediminis]|uniref:hypothetical protein n=1 Tax=Aquimarina sediminis TaxID=2070536 RepID=UPI0013E8CD9C|nr:hypothetical protein [Aquimarina sediminis]